MIDANQEEFTLEEASVDAAGLFGGEPFMTKFLKKENEGLKHEVKNLRKALWTLFNAECVVHPWLNTKENWDAMNLIKPKEK